MARSVKVELAGYSQVFATGREILDAVVTLGQQEKSSSCDITIADPTGEIAAALIKHTLDQGGIAALPGSNTGSSSGISGTNGDLSGAVVPKNGNYQLTGKNGSEPVWSNAPKSDAEWELLITQEALRQGVTDKGQIAYILATAKGESSMGRNMVEDASGSAYEGRRDLGNVTAGDGKTYRGRGLVQVTGKLNYERLTRETGENLVQNPDLATRPDIASYSLVNGMINGRFTGAKLGTYVSGEKRDFYNARRVVNGIRADQVGKYQTWANEYYNSGKVDQLISKVRASGNTSQQVINKTTVPQNLSKPDPKVDQKNTSKPTTTTPTTSTTPATSTPTESTDIVKGNKITVTSGGIAWEFYHQATETDDQGMTKINGQGIRWVLSRRDRNKTEKSLSLKQLAEKIAKAHGAKLEWLADFDPQYTFIDQTGISDYALLKREAEQNGLFVSEQNLVISVKSLRNIRDTAVVIKPGLNLISYVITDLALDKLKDDASSSLVQQDAKVELDILKGQFKQVKPEVDPAKDKASTGKKQEEATGTLAPGQEAIAAQQKGRVKRVQGLPSRFTVVTDDTILELQPLDAVRTQGLPGVLSRVWLVDSVTHQLSEGTTEINCYSPIEVIGADTSALQTPSAGSPTPGQVVTPVGKGTFIWGTTGTISDTRHLRSVHPVTGKQKYHHGTDVAAPIGTPVVSSSDAVVTFAGVQSGYGNVIYTKNSNGIEVRYGHLSAMGVRVGQTVKQGEVIGKVGNTGVGTGAHLHQEFRDPSGNSIDPTTLGLSVTKGAKVQP